MTTKVDGTNGVLQSYDYQVLTTGFSYTFAAGTTTLVINPAGTLATGTITMPAAPADGMVITIESTQQVTAVTVSGNTGQTIVGAPVQLVPNRPLSYVYRLTNTTWYPMAGGTGRATSLVSGTSVASTSGTSIDFTSIPSWVKRITVMFQGVSTNGTSLTQIQIGTSGGVQTSGYTGTYSQAQASANALANLSAGFVFDGAASAAAVRNGFLILSLLDSSTGIWSASGQSGRSDSALFTTVAGIKSLSGTLDRVRITTVNGTDTFDAGSINILME
jgi:hypothetical protein